MRYAENPAKRGSVIRTGNNAFNTLTINWPAAWAGQTADASMKIISFPELAAAKSLGIPSPYYVLKIRYPARLEHAVLEGNPLQHSFASDSRDTSSYVYFDHERVPPGAQKDNLRLDLIFSDGTSISTKAVIEFDISASLSGLRQKRDRLGDTLAKDFKATGNKSHSVADEIFALDKKTDHVSAHSYGDAMSKTFGSFQRGFGVDIGSGCRESPFWNVVNVEIFDYPSTDVIAFGDRMPFEDNAFDFAICLAVLEHVPNPFLVAAEIERIVKPGGEILVAVPFLQHLHGYPHHYFNATQDGIEQLFSKSAIQKHFHNFSCHPIRTLRQVIADYFNGLKDKNPEVARKFLDLKLRDVATIEVEKISEFLDISDEAAKTIAHANFSLFTVK